MNAYPLIASRLFNAPLLIHPQKLDAIIAGLGPRLFGREMGAAIAQAVSQGVFTVDGGAEAKIPAEMFSTKRGTWSRENGYAVVDGVAVINMSGALVHRSRMEADSTYLLGYNDIVGRIEAAMNDSEIHAVLPVFDTPGGEVQGAFEGADRLLALRGKKPMIAIADGMAASAGYLLASQFEELTITQTGYAGSIGVVMRHVDFSAALASDGIKVTHVFAGAHKVDGNQFEPLPEAVRADMQAEIDSLYRMLVSRVAAAKGLSEDAVRQTQAQTYRGQAAVDAGLASRIATTDQLITELAAKRTRVHPVGQSVARVSATATQEESMTGTTTPTGQTESPVTLTQADLDRARAEGHAAGVGAEQARVNGIFALDGAQANHALAMQCVSAGLNVEQATAILGAAAPVAAASPAAPVASAANNAFAAAMAAVGNPAVSGIEAGGNGDHPEAAAAASIVAAFRGK